MAAPLWCGRDVVPNCLVNKLALRPKFRAAKWFQQYMTGTGEGQWMHAHSNIGSAPNNMGNESYFRWTKLATNSKKQVSLNHFLGGFISYAANVNHEEFSKISDMLPILPPDLKPTQLRPFCLSQHTCHINETSGYGAEHGLGLCTYHAIVR